MDPETLLQTHAEVAIALAGFASVIAALRRPLEPLARQRFLSLLALSLIQVMGCLLPLWWLPLFTSPATGWRLTSAAVLVLFLARMRWLVALPMRTLGPEVGQILHPAVSRLVWGSGFLTLLCLALNVVGHPIAPSFDVYYAGLLANLLVGFALFADVATSRYEPEAETR